MNGKEQIINSILADARKNAEEMKAGAAQKADETVSLARDEAARLRENARAEAEKRSAEAVRDGLLSAGLELKKYELTLKQRLLSRCFDEALKKILSMPEKDYLAFIAGLLKKSEEGETVIVSQKDKNVITQDFIDKNAKGKKLALSKQYGDFSGGIKLAGDGYEKNLTLGVLLASLREETGPELNRILFKD